MGQFIPDIRGRNTSVRKRSPMEQTIHGTFHPGTCHLRNISYEGRTVQYKRSGTHWSGRHGGRGKRGGMGGRNICILAINLPVASSCMHIKLAGNCGFDLPCLTLGPMKEFFYCAGGEGRRGVKGEIGGAWGKNQTAIDVHKVNPVIVSS
jgi:hypothetical protein